MLSNACTMWKLAADIRDRHIHCLYFMDVVAGCDAKVYIMRLTVDKQSIQIHVVALANNTADIGAHNLSLYLYSRGDGFCVLLL